MIKVFLLDVGGNTRTTAAWQKMWRLHVDATNAEPCLHNRPARMLLSRKLLCRKVKIATHVPRVT